MKRLLLLFILVLLSVSLCCAEETDVHRFGTYNIRYTGTNNKSDTGDKLWENRRDYVFQLIHQYDFDVIGLQEVTGQAGTRNQLNDVRSYLSDYDVWAVEREGKAYEHNCVCYKKSRYDLLDKGLFYLNEHPETPGIGWSSDDDLPRAVAWCHLQDKQSQEEFYFACCHVNYGRDEGGIESAQLIASWMRNLAGQTPVVVVGDFNTSRREHESAYRGYLGEFYDSYNTPIHTYLPIDGTRWQQNRGTGWESGDLYHATRFDDIFYDHMECLELITIAEDYGRSITPSDHMPVLCRFRLQSNEHPTRFYASDETSLRQAMNDATMRDTICLTAGEWILQQSIVPDKSLCFIGGYDASFQNIIGLTSLKVNNQTLPVFYIPHYYALELQNLEISSAHYDALEGGAAICTNGSWLRVKHCTFSGDSAVNQGGAISATTHSLYIEDCTFIGNSSKSGGAVKADVYSQLRIRDSRFQSNTAAQGGAVWVGTGQTVKITNTSFWQNTSEKYGALACQATSGNFRSCSVLNCAFLDNTLTAPSGLSTVTKKYGGTGLYVSVPDESDLVNVGLCSFIGNHTNFLGKAANFVGAALQVQNGKTCLMDNLLLGNTLQCSDANLTTADVSAAGANVWRNTDNISTTMAGNWTETVPQTISGKMTDGHFVPEVTERGAYRILTSKLGDMELKSLSMNQRLCSSAFGLDIYEDGKLSSAITIDMLGGSRGIKSMVGALETSTVISVLEDVMSNADCPTAKFVCNGRLYIRNINHIYNAQGALIQ